MVKILLIEDPAGTRNLYSKALIEQGHQVTTISDSDLLLKKIADYKPDLVLLDLVLGEANNWNVLKKIKRLDNKLPVIIFSANEIHREFVQSLTNGHYIKENDTKEIKKKIMTALRRRSSVETDNDA